jgi:hypothetical protein
MKAYKCYYLVNGKIVYLERKDHTTIFVSLEGLKASITQREKNKRWYLKENYKRDIYYVETYNLVFEKVEEI